MTSAEIRKILKTKTVPQPSTPPQINFPTMILKMDVFKPNEQKATDANLISISKSVISFGDNVSKILQIHEEDYIMIGHIGSAIYFAKRPAKGMEGFKLSKQKKATRMTCFSMEVQKTFLGQKFELGEVVTLQQTTSEGTMVDVKWIKGVPVK